MTTTLEKRPSQRLNMLSPRWAPFNRFFRNDFLDLWNEDMLATIPPLNITEEENNYLVDLAAPGLKKEDFDITVDGDLLTISCEKETKTNEDEKEKSNFSRKEYNYSYFSRTITLPEYVESEDIAAKYTDGVLSLTIPKKPESKSNTNQKIKIQ